MLLPLRIDAADVVEALHAVSASTRASKAGPDAAALDLLLRWSDTWPTSVLGAASRQIVHHQPFANLVVTNVRGPDRPLRLLGSTVREIVPIVPLGGNLTVGVAVLSYAGNLVMGIHGDAEACPDLELFADGVRDAFELLRARSA